MIYILFYVHTYSITRNVDTHNGSDCHVEQSDLDLVNADHDLENSDVNPDLSALDPENSDLDPDPSAFDPENSDLDPDPSAIDPENSDLDPDPSALDPENSDLDPDPSAFNPENSDLDPDPSAFDPENSDLDPDPSVLDPENSDLDPDIDPDDSDSDDNSEPDVNTDESMDVDSNLFEPLYDGASITVCGAYCALMEFKRACKLPFSAILMLLQLLQLLCPPGNKLPRSVYVLKKFFQKHSSQHERKLFCPECHTELTGKQQKCTNAECQGKEPNYLITLKPDRAISNILRSK